ncbi:MAG TPA: HEAT repeat domain-containing protein [Saprospiraceae bacterium]|nr:HEAT repeat domain-containing protein [Saprospiraceae bacterium]HNT21444.1 HEAT repeat domain-containing protein [Saprospiraceae bacterium]
MNFHHKNLYSCLFLLLASALLTLSQCGKSPDAATRDIEVPEGFTIEVAAGPDLVDYPMFAFVDETGRLFVYESTGNVYNKTEDALKNPQFRIKLLVDEDGDGFYDKYTVFADKVGFPQGGVFYKGSLYASSAPELLKLTDTDGDGVADQREVLLSGWELNVNANSLIGPFMAPDGWLYLTSAIEGFDIMTREGEHLKGETARVWRLKPDGSGLQWISAGGMNNPVGLAFTAASEVLGTQTYFTEPKAGLRDALMYWTEGGVYPKPNNNITRDRLPLTGDLLPVVTKYSRVAPAGIIRYRGSVLDESYRDNLFSAQFNTHRVLRHQLIREGASFRTEDEVFFSSENEDFHPTDVLEDGDGSLLVVETGGWFIKGCPLSQVSKPELKGSIYRVRKKDAAKMEDPFGNHIEWAGLDVATIARYIEDARPFVADRAVNQLVDRSQESVASLAALLTNSPDAHARTRIVYALYRIHSSESIAALREGLKDKDLQVRVAAAKALGLAKDQGSVDQLIQAIQTDLPAVRRQAATAIGQIGEPRAIPALLQSADGVKDRFVEHAIIYSLLSMNRPDLVKAGLTHPSDEVKRAALIALDQMQNQSLKLEQVTPFLASADSMLESAARWVISHHPEWAPDFIVYLQKQLNKPEWSEADKTQLKDILVSFCGDGTMQRFMADQMAAPQIEKKLFVLESMSGCNIKEFPAAWIGPLGKELTSNAEVEVKLKVLKLIRLYGVSSLDHTLKQVAGNKQNPAILRIHAIGTSLRDSALLTSPHFDYLYTQIQPDIEASIRQQAAGVLGQAKLSDDQLLKIAKEFLGKADAFILPRLMPVFQGAKNLEIGTALAGALERSPGLDNFTEEYLHGLFSNYPPELNEAKDQLMAKLSAVQGERLSLIHAIENSIVKGDIVRGRELFLGKAICYTCHVIGNEGAGFGPDLTSIQRDRSAHDLVEAIVYPGVSFVREYETYRISTKEGTFTGIIQEQTGDMIRLGISPQESVQIQRSDILSTEILEHSMMPAGLDKLLTEQEMADLLAFLIGQDQDPETDARLLR